MSWFSFGRIYRAAACLTAVVLVQLNLGCGGSAHKEIEIVAPEAPIPIHNPDPKAHMSGVNELNEFQHPDQIKGSMVKKGQ